MSDASGFSVLGAVVLLAGIVVAVLLMWALSRSLRNTAGPQIPVGGGPRPDGRRWAAVIAHGGKIDDGDARRHQVVASSVAHGWEPPLWLPTTADDQGAGQARTALASGASAVLVFGGDGTVRTVAQELAHTDVPIGLLPAGTGNLLARNLGIKLSPFQSAIDTALSAEPRLVDMGRVQVDRTGSDEEVETQAFLVMTGLGFDAEVMATVAPRLKERIGWGAYVVAGLKLLRGSQTKVRISVDGGDPLVRRVRAVVVGNCGELQGGIRLMPDAEIDDGWLDVVVVSARGLLGWAAVVATVMLANRSTSDRLVVTHLRCKEIEIRADRPMHAQMDGEPAGEAMALRASIDPLAVRVAMPPR